MVQPYTPINANDSVLSDLANIFNGNAYSVTQPSFIVLAASASYITISTRSKRIRMEAFAILTNATDSVIELFGESIIAGGNTLNASNRNDDSHKEFSSTVNDITSAVSSEGRLISQGFLIGPDVKTNEVANVSGKVESNLILKANTNYSIKISNKDNNASKYIISIRFMDEQ